MLNIALKVLLERGKGIEMIVYITHGYFMKDKKGTASYHETHQPMKHYFLVLLPAASPPPDPCAAFLAVFS